VPSVRGAVLIDRRRAAAVDVLDDDVEVAVATVPVPSFSSMTTPPIPHSIPS